MSKVPKLPDMLPPTKPAIDFFYEMRRGIWLFFYRLAGWKIVGKVPEGKFVLIAAPHTTNWDLPLMLAVAYYFRVRLNWMGKASLFKGPFGWLMKSLGGIAIDRSKSNDMVSQVVEEYARRDEIFVAIPPEGTRGSSKRWKTGFYHIANGAQVPIVCGFLDFPSKTAGAHLAVMPTGDYPKDMAPIFDFYEGITGKFPELMVDPRASNGE